MKSDKITTTVGVCCECGELVQDLDKQTNMCFMCLLELHDDPIDEIEDETEFNDLML